MKIIETNLKFKNKLSNRKETTYIILHHRAGNGDVTSIHTQHINQDYGGIGYHYYVRKDGSIYRGRPDGSIGAHCKNYNSSSVGVCFEGNFENEKMLELQKKAGIELVAYLKGIYKSATVIKHKDVRATSCPGKNFPFDDIVHKTTPKIVLTSANDIIWELKNGKHKVEISEVDRAVKCLDEAKKQNNSLYWILYKIVNKE